MRHMRKWHPPKKAISEASASCEKVSSRRRLGGSAGEEGQRPDRQPARYEQARYSGSRSGGPAAIDEDRQRPRALRQPKRRLPLVRNRPRPARAEKKGTPAVRTLRKKTVMTASSGAKRFKT